MKSLDRNKPEALPSLKSMAEVPRWTTMLHRPLMDARTVNFISKMSASPDLGQIVPFLYVFSRIFNGFLQLNPQRNK